MPYEPPDTSHIPDYGLTCPACGDFPAVLTVSTLGCTLRCGNCRQFLAPDAVQSRNGGVRFAMEPGAQYIGYFARPREPA